MKLKALILCLVIICCASVANAQVTQSARPRGVSVLPATPCSERDFVQLVGGLRTTSLCKNGLWETVATGSGVGTVTSVSGTSPINVATGTTTPVISLNDTAVTPGSYTSANITVDQKGRITTAVSGSAGITNTAPSGTVPVTIDAQGNQGPSGTVDDGTTISFNLPVSQIDLQNNHFLRGRNIADTDWVPIIGIDADDDVTVGNDLYIPNYLVLKNDGSQIRHEGSFAAGAVVGMLKVDADGNLFVGFAEGASPAGVNLLEGALVATPDSTTITASTAITLDSKGGTTTIGDAEPGFHATQIVVNDATQVIALNTPLVNFGNAAYVSCTALSTNASGDLVCTVSDRRSKNIKSRFTFGLEALRGIKPQFFTWKDGRQEGLQGGLIAQNVRENLPVAVSVNGAGNLQLEQNALNATFVNSFNELRERVESLEAENLRQRIRVRKLENENARLRSTSARRAKRRCNAEKRLLGQC